MLNDALDLGLTEAQFWDMTFAELDRYANSKQRVEMRAAQEKATFDYILGDLIGRSIARLYNQSNKYPDIGEVYPTLFEAHIEKQQEKQAELFAARFKQFAQNHNQKFKEGVQDD